MKPLRQAVVERAGPDGVALALAHGWRARVTLPGGRYGRLALLPPEGYREPRTWAIAHGRDVPWEGRARDDVTGLAPAATAVAQDADRVTLTGLDVAARIRLAPFGVDWSVRVGERWQLVSADRPTYAYAVATRGTRIVHATARDGHDNYYGLGDKTGGPDLTGRRLRTLQLDALGYDAASSDPLYKHWPFFVGRRVDAGAWYGVYYDTLSAATFDFGQEFDNYHGFYRATEIDDGDLDLWFVPGPSLPTVVRRFVELTGATAMPPRWSLGYANTAMGLADAPDAQARIEGFLQRAKDERIPLSAFHMGSGYSSRGKRRYVFTWNTAKFPDARAFAKRFRDAGVRLVANIKPCLLDDHPAYADVAARGAFVSLRPDATPALSQFWDGWGAHVDFTHPEGIAWWQQGLTTQLLDVGILGWNDNNEYEIWDEDGFAHGFGEPMPIARARPLHALLMTRATYEAQARHAPAERVYTVTRAGPPGIQRHAQTWTGDNTTSWRTLRYNQRMALTMGLSGLFDTGHDVGGFAGPVPDAELLVRWAQACALNPRYIMNSWKADGSVNTPWLHPAATPHVRAAILLRLALMPYLYTQRWLASVDHAPVLRPTFFDFPDDPACHDDGDEMMVGPDLLVAPVFEPGATERELYLPVDGTTPAWCEFDTGVWHAAGRRVRVAALLGRLPLFVRAGGVIPTADVRDGARATEEPSRVLRCFPAPPGRTTAPRASTWIEDDGHTHAWRDGDYLRATLRTTSDDREVRLDVRRDAGRYALPQATMAACLPPGDPRSLVIDAADLGVPVHRA